MEFPVSFIGALRDPSGHADEARGFLRALEAAGHEPGAVELRWLTESAGLSPADEALLSRQIARGARGPGVAVHHYLPFAKQLFIPGRVNVARAMFETDSLPSTWLAPLLERDEVWVPCEFNVETFQRGGVPRSRLRVIGETLDFDLFSPGCAPLELPGDPERFAFLSNFDFSERKGWRQLLLAWAQAFGPDDPVRLVLKTGSFYTSDEDVVGRIERFLRQIGAHGRTAPIHFLTATLPARDMPRLYAGAGAYVLPSRGEGWGRPFMEALAMGLPTVASRFSGTTEFMHDDYSWLVEGRLVPVADDAELFNPLYRGHRWFEADVDDLAATLRAIAADPAAARAKAAKARPVLLERFGPEATAAKIAAAAEELRERQARTAGRPASCIVRGDFGGNHSLAVVNDGIADGLEQRGHVVVRRPKQSEPLDVPWPTISHGWPPRFDAGSAGPSVVVLPWEYGAPPREWAEAARRDIDRVVVPSEYVRAGFVEGGMPPGAVEVVPNGVDLARMKPEGPARDLGRTAQTVFLFVGGTIWRKGVDLLLDAWADAFGPDDDVLLVVKDFGVDSHYRGQTNRELIRATAVRTGVAPILHLEDHLPPDELPALYRAADVLVAPYRGEGFGLPILEAMACGVPPIHTAIGPSAEFVPADAGWAVAAERRGLGNAALPTLAGDGYVHEVDVDALAATLRAAAQDPADRRRRGAAAARHARAYGWDRPAEAMERCLATLAAEALPPVGTITPERPESRGTLVAYAPDWEDGQLWQATLLRWLDVVDPAADVTLALTVAEPRASAAADAITALIDRLDRPELPDLALHSRPDDDPLPLVCGADAVLLDDRQAQDPPAVLVRRAARVITLDDVTAAGVAPQPTLPEVPLASA